MAHPRPACEFDTDSEYLKQFWQMSEFGIQSSDYEYFERFWQGGYQEEPAESEHRNSLPAEGITVYRGYCQDSGRWDGFSWTPSRSVASFFARRRAAMGRLSRPALASMTVGRDDIDAILLDREVEYIITCPPTDSPDIEFL